MWLLFGAGAILFAVLNVIWSTHCKDAKWFCYLSLSLTALTLCAFYSMETSRVLQKDWSALMDVMPSMSTILWVCTIASILINSIALFRDKE